MGQLEQLKTEAMSLPERAEKLEVQTQVGYANAADLIKGAKGLAKSIKEFFEPTIEGFKKAKAAAEKGRKDEVARMDKFLAPVTEAANIVIKKCKDYENEQERIAEEERQAKLKEAEAAREFLEDEGLAAEKEAEAAEVAPEINKVAGLGIRRVWKWRIKDETKIPRYCLKIDEVKVNRIVKELKDKSNLAGIEVYFE